MGHWEDGDRHEMWGQVFHDRIWVEDEDDAEDPNALCKICETNLRMGEYTFQGQRRFSHIYCERCFKEVKKDFHAFVEKEMRYGLTEEEFVDMIVDVIEDYY